MIHTIELLDEPLIHTTELLGVPWMNIVQT